jgi:hypothetical protein
MAASSDLNLEPPDRIRIQLGFDQDPDRESGSRQEKIGNKKIHVLTYWIFSLEGLKASFVS